MWRSLFIAQLYTVIHHIIDFDLGNLGWVKNKHIKHIIQMLNRNRRVHYNNYVFKVGY